MIMIIMLLINGSQLPSIFYILPTSTSAPVTIPYHTIYFPAMEMSSSNAREEFKIIRLPRVCATRRTSIVVVVVTTLLDKERGGMLYTAWQTHHLCPLHSISLNCLFQHFAIFSHLLFPFPHSSPLPTRLLLL